MKYSGKILNSAIESLNIFTMRKTVTKTKNDLLALTVNLK